VGDNIAWELALIKRFGVTVHAFDPTPASVAWIHQQALPDKFWFSPLGIASHNGWSRFRLPQRGSRFNYEPFAANEQSPGRDEATLPVRRLATMLKQQDCPFPDVLKLDIEGGEYAVLDDVLASGIRPRQILVEFHHHRRGGRLAETVAAVRQLNSAGYQIFHVSRRALEFSFLHAA
jgi:FkbM family methyltransferase